RDLDRVAGVAEVEEVHPLDDASTVDVQTRDDALGQHAFGPATASVTASFSVRRFVGAVNGLAGRAGSVRRPPPRPPWFAHGVAARRAGIAGLPLGLYCRPPRGVPNTRLFNPLWVAPIKPRVQPRRALQRPRTVWAEPGARRRDAHSGAEPVDRARHPHSG